ncbi:MAG: deoxyribose-phosphate aldolase [Firmicutes bacterium]|nr:deoxyribose-phosphate aldolase [Bacillota bacterium]
MSAVKVICLGELLIDFVALEKDASLEETSGFAKAPGGAPANVAVGVQKLGTPAGFIGRVGDDQFGRFLAGVLKTHGVDVSRVTYDPFARTTLSFVARRSDGTRDCMFYRNPGADMMLSSDDMDEAYFRGARIFHFGSISLIAGESKKATLKALELARAGGLIVSYDPNLRIMLWDSPERARAEILGGFKFADIAKVSEEEWEFITGTRDLKEGAEFLLGLGPRLVVASLGERGCYFNDGRREGYFPAFKVEVRDTTGAGDGFVAVILSEVTRFLEAGETLDEIIARRLDDILVFANAVGALTASKIGAIPGLPTREEAMAFMRERLGEQPSEERSLGQRSGEQRPGAEQRPGPGASEFSPEELAGMIDHTLLNPQATLGDVDRLCEEARRYGFAAVAVNPAMVEFCARRLAGSRVGISAAVGFPLGQATTEAKVFEARDAIAKGASEVDFVINIGRLKSGDLDYVEREIKAVVEACRGHITKVILETFYLTDEEKAAVVDMAIRAGADFVKTSTGFGPGGATLEDVALMKRIAGDRIGIKASGGIRTREDALRFIAAGATRIGTSRGVALVAPTEG